MTEQGQQVASPQARIGRWPVGVLVVSLLGLLIAVVGRLAAGAAIEHLDVAAVDAIARWRTSALVGPTRVLTNVGRPAVLSVLVIAWSGLLALRNRRIAPVLVAILGVGGLAVLETGIKDVVSRPRPAEGLHAVAATGFSFPSGHASVSTAALLLCVLVTTRWGGLSGRRNVWWIGAVILAVGIGCSRVVLGVHYPTDVLAGWDLAAGWVAAVALALNRLTLSRFNSHR